MADSKSEHDNLRMASNPVVTKMLEKNGGAGETVLFSVKITKVNKRDKQQTRALLITDAAVYNLDPTNHSKCKRRIEIKDVGSITCSNTSEEFVIHIPDEYDYRFVSAQKDDIIKCLKKQFKAITGKSLKTSYIMESDEEEVKAAREDTEQLIKGSEKVTMESFDLLKV
jgi:hypothetical protein